MKYTRANTDIFDGLDLEISYNNSKGVPMTISCKIIDRAALLRCQMHEFKIVIPYENIKEIKVLETNSIITNL